MAEPIPPPPPPPQALYALMQLLELVGLVIALGVASLWKQTFGALFNWLAGVLNFKVLGVRPLGSIAHGMAAAESRVQNFFSHVALAREPGFTTFLTYAEKTQGAQAAEVGALAQDSYATMNRIQAVFVPWFVSHKTAPLTTKIGTAQKTATGAKASAKAAQTTATGAKAIAKTKIDAKTHVKVSTTTAGAKVHTRTQALTIPAAIGNISTRTSELEKRAKATAGTLAHYKWLLAFGGLTAFGNALFRSFGLRWLKCPSLSRIGSRIGCGGFAAIEEFLGTAFEALVVLDLCRFALGAQRLARIVLPQLGGVLLVQNAVCLGGGAEMPTAIDQPKTKTKITLPSAHD